MKLQMRKVSRKVDKQTGRMSSRRFFERIRSAPLTLETLALGSGLIVWFIVTDVFVLLPPVIFPDPSAVARSLWQLTTQGNLSGGTDYGPNIFGHTIITIQRLLAGFLIALMTGSCIGMLMGTRRWVNSLASPYVELLRSIPPITFIPLSIAWFGFSILQKTFLVFLGGFWPVLLNTRAGVRSVPEDFIRAGLMLGMNRRQILWKVILPATLPDIATGARIAVGTSSLAVFGAELAGANNGLGWLTMRASELLHPADVITGMIFIGLIGLGMAAIFRQLENRLLHWYYVQKI